MKTCNYIAVRILLLVAEHVADYTFKTEIERLTRDIKELIKQDMADDGKS